MVFTKRLREEVAAWLAEGLGAPVPDDLRALYAAANGMEDNAIDQLTGRCRTRTRSGPSWISPRRTRLFHKQRTEAQLRFIGVVASASQLEILDRRRTAGGVRRHVVEFQEAAFGAAAVRAQETPSLGTDYRMDMQRNA